MDMIEFNTEEPQIAASWLDWPIGIPWAWRKAGIVGPVSQTQSDDLWAERAESH